VSPLNLTGRAETEADLKAMAFDGTLRRVRIGSETTWGHLEIEPQVELGDLGVIDNVPTLVVPRSVSGLVQDALLTVERLQNWTAGAVVETGSYRIIMRAPGTDPGIVKLVLRSA
jgi:hypothetical protein